VIIFLLADEIQHYQTDLDDLREKGRAQIDRYVGTTPNIQATIEKQLKNVQDSYDSLLHTAIQIKNRLVESLAKFKEYEDTLDSIMRTLESLEPVVMEEVELPVSSLSEAQKRMENAKVLTLCFHYLFSYKPTSTYLKGDFPSMKT